MQVKSPTMNMKHLLLTKMKCLEMADPPKVRNTGRKSITSESLRSLLSKLRSLSFLIEHDDDLLENIYKELNNLIRSVKSVVPKESCLPLLSNKIKKGPKHKGFNKYHKLPAPKRKSTKFKRVGEKKEKLLPASKIEVTFKPEKKINVEAEIINDNLIDNKNLIEFTDEHIIVYSDEEDTGTDEKKLHK